MTLPTNKTMENVTESTAAHCTAKNFTDSYGMLVQGILAFLAFSFLIVKRLREPKEQRRPWLVWFYDTSKQALGAALIHIINILLSMVSLRGDACTWYIIYFLLDTTAGLFFIWILVKISQKIVTRYRCETLRFGEYGKPPQCDAWIGQCGVFIIIVVVEKIFITLLTIIPFWTKVAEVLLSPIHNPKVELTLVMLIIPFILNSIMFWVVDNFLMGKSSKVKSPGKQNVTRSSKKSHTRSPRVHYRSVPAKTSDGSESEVLVSYDEDEERSAAKGMTVTVRSPNASSSRNSDSERERMMSRNGDMYL